MSYQQSILVDTYISTFDPETQRRLTTVRKSVQATFPKTIEDISYGIPTYRPEPKKRGIVHYGATKTHIGIYGIFDPVNNSTIHELMKTYRTGKGTLQFKNDEPLPITTIRQILAYQAAHLKDINFTKS